MAKARRRALRLLLPVDAACIKDFPDPIDAPVDTVIVPVTAIPANMEGCDIGPESMNCLLTPSRPARPLSGTAPWRV